MYLEVVTFELAGMSDAAYAQHAATVAPRFAETPGLRSKIWIAEPGSGVRGGVYLWEKRAWAERHNAGPLHGRLLADERFAGVQVQAFDVLDEPTGITRWGFSRLAR